jgi:16S rRNA G1207 methylase RsmC
MDGVAIHGTPKQIVESMRNAAWDQVGIKKYKKAVRGRAWQYYHELICVKSDIQFLKDLERLNEIIILNEEG